MMKGIKTAWEHKGEFGVEFAYDLESGAQEWIVLTEKELREYLDMIADLKREKCVKKAPPFKVLGQPQPPSSKSFKVLGGGK